MGEGKILCEWPEAGWVKEGASKSLVRKSIGFSEKQAQGEFNEDILVQ